MSITAQEVFDLAVDGCLRQQRKCLLNQRCVYRGANGTKCAAGFVFTDEEVAGMNIGRAAYEAIALRAPRLRPHESLLGNMQRVHDSFSVLDWPDLFRDIARDFELSTAVIDRWEAEQKAGAE